MKCKKIKNTRANIFVLSAMSVAMLYSTASHAVDYYLCAQQGNITMPDGVSVPMWGFVQDDDNNLANGCGAGVVQVPGPALTVADNDAVLNIHLKNIDIAEPVSIVIPGQHKPMAPVKFPADALGRQRVRSFDAEANIADAAETLYTWNNIKPGTFVYQSGTHPQVQIQMGLFGAVTKNALANQAYSSATTAFDSESIIFYTEVDPVLHNQVANGEYGTTGMTSTFNYNPAYFLVNGVDELSNTIIVNQTRIMRFINMGLKTHIPVLHNEDFKIIAEDGHEYQYPRNQYSIAIPAGQTKDALFTPTVANDYPMFDRILNLTNKRAPVVVALAANSATGETVTSPGSLVTVLQVGTNVDTDAILDRLDNCLMVANANQIDTDNDGFGNACDADFNNDGFVGSADLGLLQVAFASNNPIADLNGDGRVGSADIGAFVKLFFAAPGPSGTVAQ